MGVFLLTSTKESEVGVEHHFNIEIAKKCGILEAILLQNIYFWVEHNRANDKSFYDGEYWTFNSIKAFEQLFPYASGHQIRRALERLRNDGYLKTGYYNKSAYDRTMWYTLTDLGFSMFTNKKVDLAENTNQIGKNATPIPYNKQISKTHISNNTKVLFSDESQKESYGNEQINEMFDEWEKMLGYKPKNSAQNRRAVYNMLRAKDKGKEWLLKTMAILVESQKDKYAGIAILGIADFADLQRDYDKVWKWGSSRVRQNQTDEESGIIDLNMI